jgi:hypothetical protein
MSRCAALLLPSSWGRTRRTTDLPLFRRSITPRALTWENCQQPSSRASTLLTGYFPYL